jgi:hypothetical protein
MNLDYLDSVPDWDEDNFSDIEGEKWKQKSPQRLAAKALYLQWRELYGLIIAFTDNLSIHAEAETETHEEMTTHPIFENAIIIAPKLMAAAGTDLYVLQMENAAVIRTNLRQLMEQVGFAVLMGFAEESYKKVIQEAMDEFRLLFKNWVATFEKDDYEDEWGLFI